MNAADYYISLFYKVGRLFVCKYLNLRFKINSLQVVSTTPVHHKPLHFLNLPIKEINVTGLINLLKDNNL